MSNILIHPNSGLIEFTTGAAGGSTFNTNFTGGAFVNRMSYDNYGGLNLTSYVSNITGVDRFTVDGANGRLFSVTDNLSGSLFSVNDIAGLPIIEAFDDNTVIMGAFNRNDFVLTGNSLGLGGIPNTGTTKLFVSGNVNVSGNLTADNLVFNTGSQTISGLKTFATGISAPNLVFNTGSQTISGVKTFATGVNISGQVELSANQAATTANSAMNRSLVDARSLVSLQGSNQTINNVATYTASNMTLSLGVGTWELNGLFYINAAATGGSKIYISVVSGAQPEAYQNRFTILRVQAGSATPTLSSDAPAYGGGTFPFRLERSLSNSADSLYHLNPSLLVLTAATQIDIGFSQNTAAVGDLILYSFSRFWAKRLTH